MHNSSHMRSTCQWHIWLVQGMLQVGLQQCEDFLRWQPEKSCPSWAFSSSYSHWIACIIEKGSNVLRERLTWILLHLDFSHKSEVKAHLNVLIWECDTVNEPCEFVPCALFCVHPNVNSTMRALMVEPIECTISDSAKSHFRGYVERLTQYSEMCLDLKPQHGLAESK